MRMSWPGDLKTNTFCRFCAIIEIKMMADKGVSYVPAVDCR